MERIAGRGLRRTEEDGERSQAQGLQTPLRLRMANGALRSLWRRGLASRPTLAPDALIRTAEWKTGLVFAGDLGRWRDRLDLLCEELEEGAHLTPVGRTIAHGQLVSALSNRLRAAGLWKQHHEIADISIPAPIIVLGQMRSGSTRMQRLLACDPRLRFTRFFESWNPVPAGRFDDRGLRGRIGLICARALNPDFDAIHPTDWNAPDEEIGLHGLSIFGAAFEAQWRVPRFARAVESADAVPVYREFKRLLQLLAWLSGDKSPRPRILKVPQFTQDIPALLEVFPDARIVALSRASVPVVASSASLVLNQMRVQSDAVDPHWVGREWLRKIGLRSTRVQEALAVSSAPRVEIAFEDMDDNWQAEMERVYRMLGMPLLPSVRARMQAYVSRAKRSRHPAHRYDLNDFGLTPANVQARLGERV